MTAGAQRYATLWSGDIKPSYDEMKLQVRGMQAAGLSGFPFWGHDAGGFYDWENRKGPDDTMYRQWSMAFGSFTPFWKPHGMGQSRWPLDRSLDAQKDAKKYSDLRYALIPFIYTYAHEASETGVPIARAMLLEFPQDSLAWKHDLQYMWGREFLVAPNCSDGSNVDLWLPNGNWYDFWNDSVYAGGREIHYTSSIGRLPLFVKTGSIIPMAFPSLGTALIEKDKLILHVYPGANGTFTLCEDDGISESFITKKEMRTTRFTFNQSSMTLNVGAAIGTYEHSSKERTYRVVLHGLTHPICFEVNGRRLNLYASDRETIETGEGCVWDKEKKCMTIFTKTMPVERPIIVKRVEGCEAGDH
jgi:alpha-D-xyloside xylohydrolase